MAMKGRLTRWVLDHSLRATGTYEPRRLHERCRGQCPTDDATAAATCVAPAAGGDDPRVRARVKAARRGVIVAYPPS